MMKTLFLWIMLTLKVWNCFFFFLSFSLSHLLCDLNVFNLLFSLTFPFLFKVMMKLMKMKDLTWNMRTLMERKKEMKERKGRKGKKERKKEMRERIKRDRIKESKKKTIKNRSAKRKRSLERRNPARRRKREDRKPVQKRRQEEGKRRESGGETSKIQTQTMIAMKFWLGRKGRNLVELHQRLVSFSFLFSFFSFLFSLFSFLFSLFNFSPSPSPSFVRSIS